ncbi:MAG: hypothetical protein QOI50_2507 [Pseudonocardiales bacterium]|nr:hypothetical protein [Pseudonocardiales bacterium]
MWCGAPVAAATLATVTTQPPSRMRGANACRVKNTPLRLTCSTCCHSSTVIRSNGVTMFWPAFRINTSSAPAASASAPAAACTDSGRARSSGSAQARRPRARTSAAVRSAPSVEPR